MDILFRAWRERGGSRFHWPNPEWIETDTLLENCSPDGVVAQALLPVRTAK
jgi:hypothetical protein